MHVEKFRSLMSFKKIIQCILEKKTGLQLFWILVALFGCVLTLLCTNHQEMAAHKFAQSELAHNKAVINSLTEMRQQLDTIAIDAKNYPEFQTTLHELSSQLAAMEKSVQYAAKSTEVHQISDQLSAIQNDLAGLIKAFASNFNTKQYVDPKTLPFKVLTVDLIAQQPFVSVEYEHHLLPLGLADSLGGWKLSRVDYDTQVAEFENMQGQVAKVSVLESEHTV